MKISLVNISSARHANIKYSPIKLHPEVKQKQQPKHWEQKKTIQGEKSCSTSQAEKYRSTAVVAVGFFVHWPFENWSTDSCEITQKSKVRRKSEKKIRNYTYTHIRIHTEIQVN